MIMVNFEFLSGPIRLEENVPHVLCIENKKLFRKVFGAFINGETEENHIIFSEDYTPFSAKGDICVISNYFELSYSNAVMKKLYDQMELYCNGEQSNKTIELKAHLVNYMESVVKAFDYDFDFNYDVNLTKLFKMMECGPVSDKTELLSNLVDYILILNKYTMPKCFVLFNLHLYFSKTELELFYKDMLTRHITLLVIENVKHFEENELENIIIYDNDFCEIVANS